MVSPPHGPWKGSLSFTDVITNYIALQADTVKAVKELAENQSTATPGKFLLLQFQMSQVTQVGDSISNLIMQVNSVIKNAVSNLRQ